MCIALARAHGLHLGKLAAENGGSQVGVLESHAMERTAGRHAT
jgi:hypothetical protein